MSVKVKFECGGCFAEAEGTDWLSSGVRYEPAGFSLPGVGAMSRRYDDGPDVQAVAPEGWIAYDPYTQCTYCPDCWTGIRNGIDSPAIATTQPPENGGSK